MVEYVVVLAVCGLALMATLLSLGPRLITMWSYSRSVLYGPFP